MGPFRVDISIEGKVTRRLARQLVRDAKHLTIRELGRRNRLSWHLIMGLVRSWSSAVGARRAKSRCRVLLVDETSVRRRHRYVTVLLNGETGEVLGMVRHRHAAAWAGFSPSEGIAGAEGCAWWSPMAASPTEAL